MIDILILHVGTHTRKKFVLLIIDTDDKTHCYQIVLGFLVGPIISSSSNSNLVLKFELRLAIRQKSLV